MNFYFTFLKVRFAKLLRKTLPKEVNDYIRNVQLKKIVKYARDNSAFYKEKYKNIDFKHFSIESIPPTTKKELDDNYNLAFTNQQLNKDKIKEFIQNKDNVGKWYLNRYLISETSGSDGKPITIVYDQKAYFTAFAYNIDTFLGSKIDMLKGLFLKNHQWHCVFILPLEMFSITTESILFIKQKLPKFISKNIILIDINDNINNIIDKLNQYKPQVIVSYPSFIQLLTKNDYKKNLNFSPKNIFVTGEKLTSQIKEDINNRFNCQTQSIYACTEGMILSYTKKNQDTMFLNNDLVFIEPVDNDGNIITDTTLSHKTYLTNLTNYTQPIIRYELNDSISYHKAKNDYVEVIGRSSDTIQLQDKHNHNIDIPSILLAIDIYKAKLNIGVYQLCFDNKNIFVRFTNENNQKEVDFNKIRSQINKFLINRDINSYNIKLDTQTIHYSQNGKYKPIYQNIS